MKRLFMFLFVFLFVQEALAQMIITSTGIKDGVIADKYGKRGTEFIGGMPSYSLPISIKNAPKEAKFFALVVEDKDAISPTGFSWIHWVVADLTRTDLSENEAISATDFVHGRNSWSSPLLGESAFDIQLSSTYGGMSPPDKAHIYDITVYALDKKLGLPKGFALNELYHAMQGHILATATTNGSYTN